MSTFFKTESACFITRNIQFFNFHLLFLLVFIRRDLRVDMKEFINKHDENECRRSFNRFTQLSEQEKRRESLVYRNRRKESEVDAPNINVDNDAEDCKEHLTKTLIV